MFFGSGLSLIFSFFLKPAPKGVVSACAMWIQSLTENAAVTIVQIKVDLQTALKKSFLTVAACKTIKKASNCWLRV